MITKDGLSLMSRLRVGLVVLGGLFALVLGVVWLGAPMVARTVAQDDDFTLTIMHTNDAHAHHDPDSDGIGGVIRQATVVQQIRDEVPYSLLVDAGDRFTGSIFHSFYQGWDSARVMNRLGYDAMVLGSYEFTHGADRLVDFINVLDVPVVVANVDFSGLPELAGETHPVIVKDFDGHKVGVIGITQGDSRLRPVPEAVFDTAYVDVVQTAVDELQADGVQAIVLLSHLGYFNDLDIATQVSGVDVIVGADSETLLTNTAHDDAEGPYPTVIESAAGEPVLVVQAWQHNRVMGRLDVTFDAEGALSAWDGDVIFLTSDIPDDPDMASLVEQLRGQLPDFMDEVLGETEISLAGDAAVCRFEECNMGNLIADALRNATNAEIAFHNGGAIRDSIAAGTVTVGDVLDVLPFNNTFVIFELSGADVIAALENSVSHVEATDGTGRFLQVSGLRFTWDGTLSMGQRIVSVEVQTSGGDYDVLDPDEIYSIATNDYLFAGGDDYGMFAENSSADYDFGRTLDEIVRLYIRQNSPLAISQTEGRIKRLDR